MDQKRQNTAKDIGNDIDIAKVFAMDLTENKVVCVFPIGSFGPNSAWGSKVTKTIGKRHPTLIEQKYALYRSLKKSG